MAGMLKVGQILQCSRLSASDLNVVANRATVQVLQMVVQCAQNLCKPYGPEE